MVYFAGIHVCVSLLPYKPNKFLILVSKGSSQCSILFLTKKHKVPILLYHEIDKATTKNHLAYLLKNCTTISLNDI